MGFERYDEGDERLLERRDEGFRRAERRLHEAGVVPGSDALAETTHRETPVFYVRISNVRSSIERGHA